MIETAANFEIYENELDMSKIFTAVIYNWTHALT